MSSNGQKQAEQRRETHVISANASQSGECQSMLIPESTKKSLTKNVPSSYVAVLLVLGTSTVSSPAVRSNWVQGRTLCIRCGGIQ